MNLDSLVSDIEALQETIRRDHTTIGSNETRTRNMLIDPLLRALGWADSAVVTQEYLVRYGPGAADYGVVDYALHAPYQRAYPIAFIEAKRMSEDLTDDHRNQAITYAFDKGGSVQYVGLTNGDRWELYEVTKDGPRTIFDLSIRDQSAFDCAHMLLRWFPMLTAPDGERRVEPSGSLTPAVHTTTLPDVPEILIEPAHTVDIPKVLAWFGVSLIFGGIVGYFVGFRAAQPVGGGFAAFGIVVAAIAVIAGSVLSRSLLRKGWRRISNGLFGPMSGDRRRNLTWVGVAVAGGGVIGGVLGYLIGLQTAQPILDMFAVLGVIVLYTLIAVTVIVVLIAMIKGRPPRRWRKRYSSGWGRRRTRRY